MKSPTSVLPEDLATALLHKIFAGSPERRLTKTDQEHLARLLGQFATEAFNPRKRPVLNIWMQFQCSRLGECECLDDAVYALLMGSSLKRDMGSRELSSTDQLTSDQGYGAQFFRDLDLRFQDDITVLAEEFNRRVGFPPQKA